MSKRTPLEETFNLPSLDEINHMFDKGMNETLNIDEDDSLDDFVSLAEYEDDTSDEDVDNTEDLKKHISETRQKIIEQKNQERQLEHLKKYHKDIDSIHSTALAKFEDIMSVAMAMEASAGSKYLASAAKLLDIALSAKNSAMDRELEMAKLQLRKEKQDHDMNKPKSKTVYGTHSVGESDEEDDGRDDVGEVYDRNELLKSYKKGD